MIKLGKTLLPCLAAACLTVATQGHAEAASIEDCEKISHWDAYNKCLASFGPKRGQRAALAPDASAPETPERQVGRRASRRGGSGFVQRRKGGRQFAIFHVDSSPRPAFRRRGR